MPHIHTSPGQHDMTASACIFRRDSGELRAFMHLHKKIGKYMQPGGHVELDETPWQAVIHELAEETGYLPEQLTVLQPDWYMSDLGAAVSHPVPFNTNTHQFADQDHYHTDTVYLVEVDSDPAGEVNEGESTIFLWMNRDELAHMNDEVEKVGADIRQVCLAAFDVVDSWQRVPVHTFGR